MFDELEQYLRGLGQKTKGETGGRSIEAAEAVLTGAQIIFRTRDNDKDADTRLEAWVNKAGNHEAAYSGNVYGHWDDWSEHLVQLSPKTNIMRKSEVSGSFIRVHITPNGNDTWAFEMPSVELFFSDGTVVRKGFGPTTLSQGTPQADFYM